MLLSDTNCTIWHIDQAQFVNKSIYKNTPKPEKKTGITYTKEKHRKREKRKVENILSQRGRDCKTLHVMREESKQKTPEQE
jgi:hypothetical protein